MFRFLILNLLVSVVRLDCPSDPDTTCFTQAEFDDALSSACTELQQIDNTLRANYDHPAFTTNPSDAGYSHFLTSDIDQTVLDDNHFATCSQNALIALKNEKNLTSSQLRKCLTNNRITTANVCTVGQVNCNPSQTSYYRLDGQCNNQKNPFWGAVNTPLLRILPAGSDDSVNVSARSDSLAITSKLGITSTRIPGISNEMATIALQILTHDLLKTKKFQLFSEKRDGGLNCVNPNNDPVLKDLISMNPHCVPVPVPNSDPCYGKSVPLLNYIKSLKTLDSCKLDLNPTPTNFETSFIDCKLIYNELSLPHLDKNGGKFDVENFDAMKEIIVGYDERSMHVPGLFLYLSFYTTLHNKVFDELTNFKTSLSQQQLSMESRKVVCSVFQKIFLDILQEILNDKESTALSNLGNCYDPTIRPGVSVEFILTFRNLHRFIQDSSRVYNSSLFLQQSGIKGAKPDHVDITSMINNLTFYTDNKCGLTHGAMDDSWNIAANGNLTTCKLFAPDSNSLGHDLKSYDFQAGRDLAEPAYIDVLRKFYNISKCDDDYVQQDLIKHDSKSRTMIMNRCNGKLKNIKYSFANALENRGILGPTDSAVIFEQMKRTVCGDRFWFSNANVFPLGNTNRILNFDLFHLVCLVNNCNGTRIQLDPFFSPASSNLKALCQTQDSILSTLDLKNWIVTS